MTKKIVPDTSVIISGVLTDLIKNGKIKDVEIIIPEFVMEELRAQASRGKEIGFKGIEEIKIIRDLAKKKKIKLSITGRRQTMEEIQLAKYGRIDALIMDVAKDEKATIITSDIVQAKVAEAEEIKTEYYEPYERKETILSKMLTKDTSSLHLKEGTVPRAKRGKPGESKLVKLRKEKLTKDEMEKMIKEINDAARYETDSFIEVNDHRASVIQLGDMRIAIARPPFSDALEITCVRPTIKLTLDDYKMSPKLKERLTKKAEGVLLSGPPGSGKSTLAASIAEFYENKGKIVKTMESPRDLQVKDEITQYTKLRNSFENTADMLLLVRPDYTIFDEIRKTEEFRIFSDMRLAGIGMLGVVHASDPVDAIQRFIGRIELGMIPHIIDTIIYVKEGEINKVYSLKLVVRTPTGMTEADLARPIVEVRNFEDNLLEYEIYTYGEENVIIPIKKKESSAIENLAKLAILKEVRRFDRNAEVDILSENRINVRVDNEAIPFIIGKKGKNIQELEEKLKLKIDVTPKIVTMGTETQFTSEEKGAYIVFTFDDELFSEMTNFYAGDEYVFSATVGKGGKVRIAKDGEIGEKIMQALLRDEIKIFI